MSDFKCGEIKTWERFVKENLSEYEIAKGSSFEAILHLAFEETMQLFKTSKFQMQFKIQSLESEIKKRDELLAEIRNADRFDDDYFEEELINKVKAILEGK